MGARTMYYSAAAQFIDVDRRIQRLQRYTLQGTTHTACRMRDAMRSPIALAKPAEGTTTRGVSTPWGVGCGHVLSAGSTCERE